MKKKVLHFVLMLLFVVAVGSWIYTSVRDEFLKQSRDGQRRTVETITTGYPAEGKDVDGWLQRLADEGGTDYEVALIDGLPAPGEESNARGNEELAALCKTSGADPEFTKGVDNAAYEEIYRSVRNWKVGEKERSLFFAPA